MIVLVVKDFLTLRYCLYSLQQAQKIVEKYMGLSMGESYFIF